jgi:hypothetical protein
MPLRVELKPFERIVIGETVIINSGTRTSFLIDGEAPILREKDTVTAETATTPVKRLYYCVQMMYLKNDIPRFRTSYLGHVKRAPGHSGLRRPDRCRQQSHFGRRAVQGAQGNQETDQDRRRAAGGQRVGDQAPSAGAPHCQYTSIAAPDVALTAQANFQSQLSKKFWATRISPGRCCHPQQHRKIAPSF